MSIAFKSTPKLSNPLTQLRNLCILTAIIAAPVAAPAQDLNLCTFVTPLIPAAKANFPEAEQNLLPTPANASSCAMDQLLSGARSYRCTWEFPYRAGSARAGYDALNDSIENCLPGQLKIRNDQSVNHPDFYQREQYQAGPVVIGISLKDRAELQGSFVFLRITGFKSE